MSDRSFTVENVAWCEAGTSGAWFVYLFPLAECSAFKVGFSCNPLQRIFTFSRRYFERFDLDQSVLLQFETRAQARAVEAQLKEVLAEFRAEAPSWVPFEAGGHTEWFSAVHFGSAEERLRSCQIAYEPARPINTFEYIFGELSRSASSFEQWALQQACQVRDDAVSVSLGYAPTIATKSLRDWLDAYRFFAVPLYKTDPAVLAFVAESARLR